MVFEIYPFPWHRDWKIVKSGVAFLAGLQRVNRKEPHNGENYNSLLAAEDLHLF